MAKISEEANIVPKSLAVEVTMKNHSRAAAVKFSKVQDRLEDIKIVNNLNGVPDRRAGHTSDSSANDIQLERMKVTSDQNNPKTIRTFFNNLSNRIRNLEMRKIVHFFRRPDVRCYAVALIVTLGIFLFVYWFLHPARVSTH